MSLTRKLLKGMGLTEEQQETILEAHLGPLNEIKDERDRYKEDADKLPIVQKQLDDLRAEFDAAKQSGQDYAKLQSDFDALKTEYETYKQDQEKKEKEADARAKFTELLKELNVTDTGIAKILKWQGTSGVELGEDGKISNARELRKAVKEEWPEYIKTETVHGAETPTPPAATGGNYRTVAEIMDIVDDDERQKAIAENHELFGF